MPSVLRWKGYRFFFYSGDENEPPHEHVDHSGRTMKVWLETLKVACNDGHPLREVTVTLDRVDQNRELLCGAKAPDATPRDTSKLARRDGTSQHRFLVPPRSYQVSVKRAGRRRQGVRLQHVSGRGKRFGANVGRRGKGAGL